MNILFRCDGSIKLGMGHVIRCLALAKNLNENHGCNIHFAMRRSELGINKVKKSYPVLLSNEISFDYDNWLTYCIKKTNCEVLIMDMRDGFSRVQLNKLKKKTNIKVITIDDTEDKRLEADLALYPPVPQVSRTSWDGFKGSLRIGWEYVIIGQEFSIKYPKPNNQIPNILLSMGATDEKNMTEVIVTTLGKINKKIKVIIIIGKGYPHLQKLNRRLKGLNIEYDLFQNPNNIAKIMSKVDFAIISFGITAYELTKLKIPAFYLCLTNDHYESSKLFVKNEVGVSIGVFSRNIKQKLIDELNVHLSKKHLIKKMSNNAKILNISDLNKISKSILQLG